MREGGSGHFVEMWSPHSSMLTWIPIASWVQELFYVFLTAVTSIYFIVVGMMVMLQDLNTKEAPISPGLSLAFGIVLEALGFILLPLAMMTIYWIHVRRGWLEDREAQKRINEEES